ncbi:MAG: hypothetical protein PHH93_09500, partial [Prolixibacteraceae bacterium]|nr:hypothetical protein [Prolixibacteraceae bacterium]
MNRSKYYGGKKSYLPAGSEDLFRRILLLPVIMLLIFINSCNKPTNEPFEAGTGVVDITPPAGFPRYGYPPVES